MRSRRSREAGVELGGATCRAPSARRAHWSRAAPLREAGHRLLMEALAARGEVAEALTAYEELRVLLRDELGMAPGEAVRGLHERLLAGETRARATAPEPPPPRPVPLPALLSRERGEFVGRERELEACARRGPRRARAAAGLVVLGGGPGIGKTRLCGRARARGARRRHGALRRLPRGRRSSPTSPSSRRCAPICAAARSPARVGGLGPGGAELARLMPELPHRGHRGGAARRSRGAPLPDVRGGLLAAHRGRGPCTRCCSCSTTCTGPTDRRSSCCATSCAPRTTPRS